MIQVVVLFPLVLALGVASFLRPWGALTALLAFMPFNGFLTDVVVVRLGLSDPARILLASWHDAIVIGFVLAAALAWLGSRHRRLSKLEASAGILMATGLISLVGAAHLATAAYAFRNLYEPVVLCLAIVALARLRGLPPWIRRTSARAIVGGGLVAVVFAWWQVYIGGIGYVNEYFRTAANGLPTAYLASLILQPRAFGPFHSPNEFGAFLVIALALTVVPKVLDARLNVRAWAAAALVSALLLTLSRSAWVGAMVALGLAWLIRPERARRVRELLTLRSLRRNLMGWAPAAVTLVVVCGIVVGTSGAYQFLATTITGREPSSAGRVETIQNAIEDLLHPSQTATPGASGSAAPGASAAPAAPGAAAGGRPRIGLFGLGLGMAGPKSARFGEIGSSAWVSSETWYVNYLLQAGIVGLAALLLFLIVVASELWVRRRDMWSTAAISIGAGLAVGALFIPVIDEPAVAIPLWTVIGLAMAPFDRGLRTTPSQLQTGSAGPAVT